MPRNVVAIGKCAMRLLDGVASVLHIEHAFVATISGAGRGGEDAAHSAGGDASAPLIYIGGHPHMTPASFAAGRALLEFVDAHDDILFLISGGGSACVEVPLTPYTEQEVSEANAKLIASGVPIGAINAERRKRSAIKGGKLRDRVRGRCVTLVYSDVASGKLADVASGPTLHRDDEGVLIADNDTLTATAAQIIGDNAVRWNGQLEGDVDEVACALAERAETLEAGQVLVAGGEPTVVVRGNGRGGRCSELALRFARRSACEALFGSSDGVDGNSGAAGILLRARARLSVLDWEESNSFPVAAQIGEPIMITPTGNNLRDLFLIRRTHFGE